MKLIRCFAMVLTLILAVSALAGAEIPAQVGAEAHDFEVETLDGRTIRLSDFRGKVVFLNIWATWCPPCVREIPDIQRLAEVYSDDLAVIGISVDEDAAAVADFVRENGLTYNIAMDLDYEICTRLYPTYAIPNSLFISADGIVTSMELGAADYETLEKRFFDARDSAL